MSQLPEDVSAALDTQPNTIRKYALEQALKYAVEASLAIEAKEHHVARAHVTCMAEVSVAWSALADALGYT